ncbi:MAG: hypothetical protein J6B48_07050 [Clostridia bacterium]|nr:hypothetical protein [Clostridia bacterium]
MKKTNNFKILVLAISLALLICGIVGVTVSAESETASEAYAVNADASLSIYKKNVSFQNAPQLVFAVGYENLDPATVTLDVWYGEKSGDATNVTSFGNVTVDGETYLGFAVEPADPKDIDKLVYVQAKSGDVASEVERYSILEFAWAGVMTSATDEEAADYYNIIDYSKSVQKWLTSSGKFSGTPVENYFYVRAEGVALDDGYDSGIFTSPVTFTLGESALGWNVTTYVDGVKNTVTQAAGTEITASASTICTAIKEPEPVKPQQVTGTPLDFENLSVSATGNGGENTTYFVGSVLNTAKKGVTEVTGKDGTTTKAYYFDSDDGKDLLRIQSHGDDTDDAKLTGANAFVFETDIKIDFATTTNTTVLIYLGTGQSDSHHAYWTTMRLDETDGTIMFLDAGSGTGAGPFVDTSLKSGDWFNLRIEYYKISADELLVLTFVDGELIYTSNRPYAVNANGDDAWPVYSSDFIDQNNTKANTGISAIRIGADTKTDATFYFDNTLLRRTTLTPPYIPVSEYDSYYTPAN